MKFESQLTHVDRATPFARRLDGKISLGYAHGTGPQDAPKPGGVNISFVPIMLAHRCVFGLDLQSM